MLTVEQSEAIRRAYFVEDKACGRLPVSCTMVAAPSARC